MIRSGRRKYATCSGLRARPGSGYLAGSTIRSLMPVRRVAGASRNRVRTPSRDAPRLAARRGLAGSAGASAAFSPATGAGVGVGLASSADRDPVVDPPLLRAARHHEGASSSGSAPAVGSAAAAAPDPCPRLDRGREGRLRLRGRSTSACCTSACSASARSPQPASEGRRAPHRRSSTSVPPSAEIQTRARARTLPRTRALPLAASPPAQSGA